MRLTLLVALSAAAVALGPSVTAAQDAPANAAASSWAGKRVILTRIDNSAKSAACPTLKQVDHYVRVQRMKWDDSSKGCRILRSGNFTSGVVKEQHGNYIRVEFVQTAFPMNNVTLWVPTRHFKVSGTQ